MNLDFTPDELAFRTEARDWLQANLPDDLAHKVRTHQPLERDDYLRWQRILAQRGWAAPGWPTTWGGPGWDVTERHLFDEALAEVDAPPLVPFGLNMCGPVLIRFGTPAQQQHFLPRILNGDDFWCQGYSEPGAGSDLAALQTRAVRDGDHYVVNGQKIWTTLAHFADWIFCLVRTGSPSGKRQEGISFLLIDMRTPGITVRALPLLDGHREVNEVFFDDVRVPVANLVHEEGQGWTVAKFLLGHERLNAGRVAESWRSLRLLKALAARQRGAYGSRLDDPGFQAKLVEVEVELMALEVTNLRFLAAMRDGQPPGAEVSLLKLRGTEIQQAITELAMDAVGPQALAFRATGSVPLPTDLTRLAPRYGNYRKASIYAGSNEIQRNILAKATLGL